MPVEVRLGRSFGYPAAMCRVPDIKRKLIVPVTEPSAFYSSSQGTNANVPPTRAGARTAKEFEVKLSSELRRNEKLSCVEGTRLAEISGPHCPIELERRMRSRNGEWSEEELKQLAAIVAAGGTPFRAAAKFKRSIQSCRSLARKLACRLRLYRPGAEIFWQNARPLRKHWLAAQRSP